MSSNLWKRFEALQRQSPLLVATVTAHNSDGTSTVQYPGGGIGTVRGQGVDIGSKTFIQDHQIQGEAPDLTLYEFEV